jgi:HEAT repeat protein
MVNDELQKIEELIVALGNGEWHPSGSHVDGQAKTIDQLTKMGKLVILPIRKTLSHENEKIRFGAVNVLGWMRPEISVEPLISTMLNDKDFRVRSQSAFWLGQYRDERTIEPFILALKDRQGYFSTSHRAMHSLKSIGKPAVEPILRALQNLSLPAIAGLDDIDNMLFFHLLAWILGEIGDTRAIEVLLPYLAHPNSQVRKSVIRSLGNIHDERVIIRLTSFLMDGDQGIREAAIDALGAARDNRSAKALISILNDANEPTYLREKAAWALGEIGDMQAVDALSNVSNHNDENLQQRAREALRKLGHDPDKMQ